MTEKIAQGSRGELIAEAYYLKRNYQVVTKNFRTKYGEIDLILKKDNLLVYAEVKSRGSENSLDRLEWIPYWKRKRMKTAIRFFEQSEQGQTLRDLESRTDYLLVAADRVVCHLSDGYLEEK